MNDHPLGTPNPPKSDTAALVNEPSIVDTILNLDELLSADVRRAEKTARICLRPELEADIDQLEAELDSLTDQFGKPLDSVVDAAVTEGGSRARTVALQLAEKRQEYAAASRSVRMRQMSDDDWTAFKAKHKAAFDSQGPSPERTAMFNDLVVRSAVTPAITAEQWVQLRKKLGAPQIDEFINVAWAVNTESGVSVPKSPLSSLVLKQTAPSKS